MMRSLLFAALGLIATGQAQAVCLLGDYSIEAESRRSTLIVTGTVTDAHVVPDPEDPDGFAGIIYRVKVTERFKGTSSKSLSIYSENASSRFPMDLGLGYLLFLERDGDSYVANNCGNSGLLHERKAVEAKLRSQLAPR